jgi:ABC-type antimicrobial peptide transport system permease subunit
MYECLMGDAVRILWSPSRCSLATLGLYGVISHMVTRRRNEIGVRIPLGADRGRVVRIAILEAVLLAVGLGIGAMLALWAGRAATTLLLLSSDFLVIILRCQSQGVSGVTIVFSS